MVISMENITVNKEFHELHFDSIQALRGLAALFVVFQHVRFLNFGAFGVDIFFCISGLPNISSANAWSGFFRFTT